MNLFARLSENERLDYFVETGQRTGLGPMVEKDFWVCWVLEKLFSLDDVGPTLIFRAGLPYQKRIVLSKGFPRMWTCRSIGQALALRAPIAILRRTSGAISETTDRAASGSLPNADVDHSMPALTSVITIPSVPLKGGS